MARPIDMALINQRLRHSQSAALAADLEARRLNRDRIAKDLAKREAEITARCFRQCMASVGTIAGHVDRATAHAIQFERDTPHPQDRGAARLVSNFPERDAAPVGSEFEALRLFTIGQVTANATLTSGRRSRSLRLLAGQRVAVVELEALEAQGLVESFDDDGSIQWRIM